jgi:predicted ATPase/DNA-binding SARP family transcriptional activator
MARLVIRFLGKPSIDFDGALWNFRAQPRCIALLALLTLARGRTSTRASLASALWPEELDSEARTNLRRHLHSLQRALPPLDGVEWLVIDTRSVRLNEEAPIWTDLEAFESAVTDPARRVEAIELYRGDLLEGSFEESLLADRERLRALYLDACRDETLTARKSLDYAAAVRYVERILAHDEWREDAVRLGMAIRYESGDRSSALAQFERFSTRLAQEMGIEPMPETLALRDAILMNAPLPGVRAETRLEDRGGRTETRLPFVGRATETATLNAAWRHAASGRGTTFFLGGAPGIGKSRLAAEFASTVSAQGGRVLFGETSNPQAYPYEPVVNALRRGLQLLVESPVEGPWLSALSEVLPELRAAFPELAQPAALQPEKARMRLLEAIARTIEGLARARPMLLVLEDLQWAQPATLDVVETLARRIGSVPALVLITHRKGEAAPGNALNALRSRLQTERLATSLDLQPLSEDDVKSLVQKVARAQDGNGDLADAIAARTGGNPLFVDQLLASYAETGELRDAGVVNTILDRLTPLDAAATTVAHTAAAIGSFFSIDVLSHALGWNDNETFDALGSLLDRGLVRASGGSAFSFAFSHALIETAVYGSIPSDERVLRHRRIAQVLSQKEGHDPHVLASIARHWSLSGEPARAGTAYADAARSALAVYARAEAIALARSALEGSLAPEMRYATLLLVSKASHAFAEPAAWKADLGLLCTAADAVGREAQFAAREELARYYSQVGERDSQRSTIEAMLAMALEMGSDRLRTKALYELALLDLLHGRLAAAMARAEEALAIAIAAGDEAADGELRHLMVRIALRLTDDAAVRRHVAALGDLAERDPSPERRTRLLECRQYVAMESDDAANVKDVGEQLLELSRTVGDTRMEVNAHTALSQAALYFGSIREMREQNDMAIAICERLQLADSIISFRLNRAMNELQVGNLQIALDLIDRLIPDLERMGAELHLCSSYLSRCEAMLMRGDGARALESGRKAEVYARKTGARGFIGGTLLRLGWAMCASGDVERGLEQMREALEMRRERGLAVRTIDAISCYVQALLDDGRIETAQPLVDELASLYEENPAWALRPTYVLFLLGRAARMTGRETAAREYFNRARTKLQSEIERFDDAETAAGFRNLPYHRGLQQSFGRQAGANGASGTSCSGGGGCGGGG